MAPVTTHSAQAHGQYANALAYLQDVVEMPPFYTNNLQDAAWVDSFVPAAIQAAPVQRALDWGFGIITTTLADVGIKFKSTKPGPNLIALLVFVTGTLPGAACGELRCPTIFGACVVPQDAHRPHLRASLRTACATCMFNYQNTRCRLYTP